MIRPVRSQWRGALLVCGKCEKKLDGGFGPKGNKRLSELLREALGGFGGRKASFGVIETKCLKVCPKRGVTIVDATCPERWLVVPEGTSVDEVVLRLAPVRPDGSACSEGLTPRS